MSPMITAPQLVWNVLLTDLRSPAATRATAPPTPKAIFVPLAPNPRDTRA